jgi:hypothetical protein
MLHLQLCWAMNIPIMKEIELFDCAYQLGHVTAGRLKALRSSPYGIAIDSITI